MHRPLLVLGLALVATACRDVPVTSPDPDLAVSAARKLALTAPITDNGDGTSTLVFQPGPGLNNNSDQGTLDAGKDAGILIHEGGQFNYGNSAWMHHFRSNCNGWNAVSLYRFDVGDLPAADQVVSVQLALYHMFLRSYGWAWQSSTTSFTLHPVLAPWSEMSVMWSTQPPIGGAVATTTLATMPRRLVSPPQSTYTYFEGWATMDITALYNAWKSGAQPNHGVEYRRVNIWCENANSTLTAGSDIIDDPSSYLKTLAAWRPKLIIRFRSAPPNRPPTVSIAAPASVPEGSPITLAANGADADGDALTYLWTVDGSPAGNTPAITRAYPDDGAHTATVSVDDGKGGTASATVNFSVTNVAPTVDAALERELLAGETARGSGNIVDPGLDTWTGTVDFGDGQIEPLAITGTAFQLSHRYTAAGNFYWHITVTDDDGGTWEISSTITVVSYAGWIDRMIAKVKAASLDKGLTNSLVKKLENAAKSLTNGNTDPALGQLNAFKNELAAATKTARFPAPLSTELLGMLQRLLAVL